MTRFRQWSLIAAITFLLLTTLQFRASLAQSGLSYLNYDVVISPQSSGDIHIQVNQQLKFEGEYSTGFFEIPIDSVSAVENVQVRTAISDEPGVFEDVENLTITDSGDAILVEWTYPTTQSGDTRIFQLDYDLVGALWVSSAARWC